MTGDDPLDDIHEIMSMVAAEQRVPTPWRVDDNGVLIDARGRPIAHLAGRLNDPGGTWRTIGNQLAAAPDFETALSDLIDDMRAVLSSPLMQEAGIAPRGLPALERALAVLAKARPH